MKIKESSTSLAKIFLSITLAACLMMSLCGAATAADSGNATRTDNVGVETANEPTPRDYTQADALFGGVFLDPTPEFVFDVEENMVYMSFRYSKATQLSQLMSSIGKAYDVAFRLELLEMDIERAPEATGSMHEQPLRRVMIDLLPDREEEIAEMDWKELAKLAREYYEKPTYRKFFDAVDKLANSSVFSTPYFLTGAFTAEEIDVMYDEIFAAARDLWPEDVASIENQRLYCPVSSDLTTIGRNDGMPVVVADP